MNERIFRQEDLSEQCWMVKFVNHKNEWMQAVPLMATLHLFSLLRTLHQQFESYKQEVRRIGAETRRQQTQLKDDAPTCGICRKTKFADGCGHLCSYCQTKFCARCGGRVSLRSNNVRNLSSHLPRSPPPSHLPCSPPPSHTHLIPAVADVQLGVLLLCLLPSALSLPGHILVGPKCIGRMALPQSWTLQSSFQVRGCSVVEWLEIKAL